MPMLMPMPMLTFPNDLFDIYLSEISSHSVTSKKTKQTVQMVCKVNSIFDEIFKDKKGFLQIL